MALRQVSTESSLVGSSSEDTDSEFSEEPFNFVQNLAAKEALLPSPIDININNSRQIGLPDLSWHNYEKLPSKIKLTNTGETVILSAKWADNDHPLLHGGPLEDKYVFSQLHFHWGSSAVEGSEHTIDGVPLPLEMHVVHFCSAYENQDEALKHVGGVLSLVYFFNLKSAANKFIVPIIANLKEITFPDSVIKLPPFPIVDLFHTFNDDYFLYWGSTKNESSSHPMLWMISRTQECIDFQQLTQFRHLLDQRMRVIQREPTIVSGLEGRHLFHVNPRTKYSNSTLSVLPHPRYRNDRWLVDRMEIDFGEPGACREFIDALRREMKAKK